MVDEQRSEMTLHNNGKYEVGYKVRAPTPASTLPSALPLPLPALPALPALCLHLCRYLCLHSASTLSSRC